MHDPLTEAFRIKFLRLTVWHVDPEKGGDDDSCDWRGHYRPLKPAERKLHEAIYALESILDNPPHYPDSAAHHVYQELKVAERAWRDRSKFRLPVRWHVWHWRLQFEWVLDFKRWAFSRCAGCGKGFLFGYCPVSTAYHGKGPGWFRGEQHTYHRECVPSSRPSCAVAGCFEPADDSIPTRKGYCQKHWGVERIETIGGVH